MSLQMIAATRTAIKMDYPFSFRSCLRHIVILLFVTTLGAIATSVEAGGNTNNSAAVPAHCKQNAEMMRGIAQARDHGESWTSAEDVAIQAATGPSEAARLVRLTDYVYDHPEIGPDGFYRFTLKICYKSK
jgi:hypothetical protein